MATNVVTPRTGLTVTQNIDTTAREVDFVTRFANNWDHLREIMGVMRTIRKTPGTVLKSKYATVTLESGNVAEGAEIPYSEATVSTKDYAPSTWKNLPRACLLRRSTSTGMMTLSA